MGTAFKSTKMDVRGRVFLPAMMRRRLGLTPRDDVEFYKTADGRVAVRKAEKKSYGR